MKIEYTPNPLFTKVILDEHEQEILKWKIRVKEMEELLHEAHFNLSHHEWWNKTIAKSEAEKRTLQDTVNKVMEDLDPEYYLPEDDKPTGLDERVDLLFKCFMSDLDSHHAGDCVCFACSCSKCYVEGLLGIDTIKGLGKHAAHKIWSAFGGRENNKTIDEALEQLQGFDPKPPEDMTTWDKVGGWAKHLPRWKTEAEQAYQWLAAYKEQHFKDS